MALARSKQITFEEFIAWYPDNSERRYELHDGVIVEMTPPSGEHEQVKGFLAGELTVEFKRLKLPYFIPNQAIVKPLDNESGYLPDILILNSDNLVNEPLWKKESTVCQPISIPLIIEVVSTNWQDDYYLKLSKYEMIGIPEYWIVDYAALGGRRFIGNPKQPTISVYNLIENEYQVTLFRDSDRIQSAIFSELDLTAQQIFDSAK
ncbi:MULTISPECIES: Uma2 family endonuclease [Nostocales]|uniref:Uma2 family endonuclease n=3 Tax=Nostocales TaxID=1161 RepID=A0A0C1N9G5_9CYAN|nr:Uma2 family endonuclease [Tolypothrix bouteillei]KAF3887371.1 Uma2 family endonuclease [Tolypothrix bouteillei VB521301]